MGKKNKGAAKIAAELLSAKFKAKLLRKLIPAELTKDQVAKLKETILEDKDAKITGEELVAALTEHTKLTTTDISDFLAAAVKAKAERKAAKKAAAGDSSGE